MRHARRRRCKAKRCEGAALMTAETVLVTGAFGLVGSETVRQLMVDGLHVIATDLDVPANRKAADQMPSTQVRWADLTDPNAVGELLREVSPSAIIHLAAIIPPACYARPALARRVNVDATRYLVDPAVALRGPPRFVQASSVAVYGPRNPHRFSDVLTADTPLRPSDIYGAHKVEAEKLVRASGLGWGVLGLGGGAPAFVEATTAPVLGETLLIGGDESHRLV